MRAISLIALSCFLVSIFLPACVAKKKYLLAVEEARLQDSLRQNREGTINFLESSITEKETTHATEVQSLNQKYQDLLGRSDAETARLNEELKAKEAELENRRKVMEAFAKELEAREARVKELSGVIARKDSITKALLQKVENVLINFSEEELSVKNRSGRIYVSLSDQLLFQSGSANVNQKGREALLKLAEVMNKNPDIQIMIEGHTDNIPIKTARFQDNWDLSVLRATSVVRILTWAGEVPATRVIASGRGEHFPIADNSDKAGRSQNRRTEIILTPDLDELFQLLDQN